MLTGDASAPQVQGWTVDSAEMQAALEQNKGNISRLKNRLKTLQEIKSAVEPLTGVEMQLTEGLTPEGFRMYRQIADWLRNVGGATARQARMGAILAARHADIYAAKVTERTGKKYTAADYMRDKLGFSVRRAEAGLNQVEDGKIRFYHGSPNDLEAIEIGKPGPMENVFWGMFFNDESDSARAHAENIYYVDIDEDKIADAKDFAYDENAYNAIKESFGEPLEDEELFHDLIAGTQTIWDVSEDITPEERNKLNKVFGDVLGRRPGTEDYELDWAFQSAAGYIADKLGYEAVWVEDEHGASVIITPGHTAKKATENEILNQRAWHGSPYDFETFDLGAIGTGEGAQVHGWGLYFAANRAVSEEYKDVLGQGRGKILYIDGKEHEWSTDNVKDKAMKALISTVRNVGDVSKVRQKLEKLKQTEDVKQALKYLDEGRVNVDYPGKLFEVEIPDNDVLLDEQKTFSKQPEKVRAVILKLLGEGNIIKKFEKHGKEAKEIAEKIIDTNIAYEDTYDLFNQLSDMQIDDDLIDRLDKIRGKLDRYSTGDEFYRYLSMKEGGPKYASELLNKNGIKGITYEGGIDGRCFVVFDDKAIDVIEKYNQEVRNQQIKGQTSLRANGKRIVSILETADESTFMHEMSHVFLYDLQDLAQIDDVSAKELEIVNEWANWQKGAAAEYKSTPWAKEFAAREQAIIDAEAAGDHDRAEQLKREWRQERFARGFELYLKDGQAPAKGLKAVFRKFKTFLRQIYAAFVSDGGKPTLPVKRVMDRMIATEQEIEAMELDDRYADVQKAGGAKLFEESEQDTYNRWYQEATDEAKEKLLKVVMKDLEKEKQAQFDLDMEQEENRKRRELQQEPVYLAEQAVMASG
ncbi:MAG: hypothetical protein IIZ87_02320, partial [Selenomonas sp.]|nr:hypothetical protein [Selenomonas sp.]